MKRQAALAAAGLVLLLASPAMPAPSYMITFNNGGAFMPEVYSATGFRRDTTFALAPSNGTGQITGGAYAGPGYVSVLAQLDCTWGGGFSGSFWGKTRASATATDFIITGPAGPTSVAGTLRLRVRVNLDRAGGYPNSGGHSAAFQLNASTAYSSALGTITSSNSSVSGSGCFSGVSSSVVDMEVPLAGNYPVRLEYGSVMTLPEGYTLNSASWNIVNNADLHQVGVGDAARAPSSMGLELVGANPSPGAFQLALDLPGAGAVTVDVFDLSGRKIRSLSTGWHPAGRTAIAWDGRDEQGHTAAAGIYFVRAEAQGGSVIRRLVRMR